MFGTMSDKVVYTAICTANPSDTFEVHAHSYESAQAVLLDKIGYSVEDNGGQWVVVDCDTHEIALKLKATNLTDALTEALTAAKWKIEEPANLIGGALIGGFSVDNDNVH